MKPLRTMIAALALIASTSAFAQNDAKTPQSANQGAAMGNAGKSDPAANAPSGASGTLMQQREKGMAPDSASGGKSTGKMKQ
ncbi:MULTISPECIES: hypothetical protein [unclassified Caballeronia]|uniref:hypothetical protein n=1 Tax=unclassified Caballeronia TaxID=2646786 RepID=UPI0028646A31|nr:MULTISPECIES: hypothetical protein [unclassified Caballeronia]MDR5750698.1 hypothetical protein [Caballeronia sp. LZ024]MDR5842270.1 hypothetical protein [Caballeronia sp. LZ031]